MKRIKMEKIIIKQKTYIQLNVVLFSYKILLIDFEKKKIGVKQCS